MFKTNWSCVVTALIASVLVALIGDPDAVWFTPVGTFIFVALVGGTIHCLNVDEYEHLTEYEVERTEIEASVSNAMSDAEIEASKARIR